MKLRICLAVALLSLPLAATRAEGEELTLGAAMVRAREQGGEATAARSRAEASAQALKQAQAFRRPTVSLHEVWIRTDSPADAFGLLLNQERFSLADFAAGDPNNPEPAENALTRLEVSLPIYTGGELSARIRQAQLAALGASETAAWQGESAALAAAEAYIRLAQVREQVALVETSLDTIRAHVRLAQAYVDQGMLVRSELLRAEVEASRLEDLLSQSQGQARVAEANLSFRLAADLATSWQLDPLAAPLPLEESLDGWLASADSRSDLEAARRRLAAGELEVQVKTSGRLPKVGLVARHDLNDDIPFGANGDGTTILAVATMELYGGGRHRAAAEATRAEVAAARVEVEQFRQGIHLAVRAAYEQARSARERQRTARAAQESASEAERITEERFKKGIVGTIDVLDAATARREADTRELVARSEAQLAILDLAVEAGRRPESVLGAADKAAPEPEKAQARTDS
jgi:outer membrane protein